MLVSHPQVVGTPGRHRPEKSPACPHCGGPSWWNGWRQVFAVFACIVGGDVARAERWLARAKCRCCRRAFTCYPPEHYPHRQFQLDVVADVAAAVAIGADPAAKAAARATASATSARRWAAWVAGLAAPALLLATAQQVDPDAPIGAGVSTIDATSSICSRASRVLAALEHLGAALVRCGVDLVSRTGLGRVLEWQHRQHADVVHLVSEPRCLSPAMASRTVTGRV
jgi:hypothetical protein